MYNIKKFEKFYVLKLYSNEPGYLTLLLSEIPNDFSNCEEISFENVVSFSDFGIVGRQIDYIDVNLLGIINRNIAERIGVNPDEYKQFFFACRQEKEKRELVVACRSFVINKLG